MSEQTVFNGRYELHRRLARGGMADVFLARDQLLDRPVAVKVLFPEFATDPAFVERFRREAQSAANLNHPNIVSVYDWGQEQGTYFIVMEYIEGRSLADIIRNEGPLHPQRAAEVGSDIAAALGFAHRNGVVHRDIKPGNVLISPSGQVKVADFGIARALNASAEDNLTQAGSVMGTATYFAPEQAQGLPLDPRSDLYSLGVVLYEMVTGRAPFTGESPVAIAYKHVQEQPAPPRHANTDVPVPLEAIIMRLLAKNPAARYPSAEDLRADLRRFREGQPVLAMGAAAAAAAGGTEAVAQTRAVQGYSDGTRTIPVEDLPPAYQEPRRSGAFLVVLILLLCVLAGLLFALAKVLTNSTASTVATKDFQVPTGLKGAPVDQAQKSLETAGWKVKVVNEKNESVPANSVIDVDPAEGTTKKAPPDQPPTATLKVSQGADTVPMPKVTGSKFDQAVQTLKAAGFTGQISQQDGTSDDPNVAKGEVIDQTPKPDEQVAKNAPIVLVVATGKTQVPVPDVAGKTAADAANELGSVGQFKTTVVEEQSDTVAKGKVIRTEPPKDTPLEKGSTVTIVVSSGKQAAVPNVLNKTQVEAENALANAGFTSKVTCVTDALAPVDGIVTDQNPGPNTMADKGTSVAITVRRPTCA
jgi:serine/threonine-protein kinase